MSIQDALRLQRRRICWWGLFPALLCILWPAVLSGQIYRYQDEQGNWHFTDDPPDRYESSVVPDIATSGSSPSDREPTHDLETSLQSTFSPITPIAYATLAVVSIQTGSGEGSGFFCSDSGHILTTRHVVLPQSTDALDDQERDLDKQQQDLQTIEANLKETRGQLQLMKKDLEGYNDLIENARDQKTRDWAKDARARMFRSYRAERDRISDMERSIRTLKPQLRVSKRELGLERRLAKTVKSRFDIILKDGTELSAHLVKVSSRQDLALLKLDGYRTPFLRLDSPQPLSQGIRVYAIGNPLGMQDAVTSGVITQITAEHLLTDAQILPGSSGGPLIRESGEVVGVNVSRKVAAGTSKYAAGFGKVVPIALALAEFPTLLTASSQGLDRDQPEHSGPNQTGFYGSDLSGGGAAGLEGSTNAGLGQPDGPGLDQTKGFGPEQIWSSGSPPVRLIIPDESGAAEAERPAQIESRSLDFPPEVSSIPSGRSPPQD